MAARGYRGVGMEGFVARSYDRNAKITGAEHYRAWASLLAGKIPPGSRILEVAPGPGYLAIELAKRGYGVTGLDISRTFVGIAKRNAAEAGVEADFRLGNASDMPWEAESFDALACTAAFKNFAEPARALMEMERVLKPGGAAWILDLKREASDRDIDAYLEREMRLKGWTKLWMGWTFKHFLRRRAYGRAQWEVFLAQTAFAEKRISETGIGFELWLVKGGAHGKP
jgi:ubiquinone/menaquinone biosynthesis C-methylase UbiE